MTHVFSGPPAPLPHACYATLDDTTSDFYDVYSIAMHTGERVHVMRQQLGKYLAESARTRAWAWSAMWKDFADHLERRRAL